MHVHDGMLVTKSAIIQKWTYSIHNVDPRAKTLIIEYPIRSGYKLIETAKPLETTRDMYRFEVKVPASGSVDFPITEENVYDQQTSVSALTPDSLLVYIRNKVLTDAARRQLQAISDLKSQIAANSTQKTKLDADIQNVTRDEDRNRQNIASLSSVSGQQQIVQDYARKLAEQETQIAKLRDQQAALDTERASLQNQLNAAISKVEF
jgi:septum formation inhibitor MinC